MRESIEATYQGNESAKEERGEEILPPLLLGVKKLVGCFKSIHVRSPISVSEIVHLAFLKLTI